jgi:hypothetical protein
MLPLYRIIYKFNMDVATKSNLINIAKSTRAQACLDKFRF